VCVCDDEGDAWAVVGVYITERRGDVIGDPRNLQEEKTYSVPSQENAKENGAHVPKARDEYSVKENHIRGGVLNVESERAFRCNGRFFANSQSGGSSPGLMPKSFW